MKPRVRGDRPNYPNGGSSRTSAELSRADLALCMHQLCPSHFPCQNLVFFLLGTQILAGNSAQWLSRLSVSGLRPSSPTSASFSCQVPILTPIPAQPLAEKMIPLTKHYRCIHSKSCQCTKRHINEDVIYLVFQQMNWNPNTIASLSCACKWFDDLAKRVLWKEFCKTRAPKMMLDLQSGGSHSVDGNWRALGKLLIYCSGSAKGGLFSGVQVPGHSVYRTRFSRTSGKSFLLPQCRTDVLYVSDPCEHLDQGDEGDIGFFRGIFKSFSVSKVKKMLIKRAAKFHPTEMCPYCKAKLWNMSQAEMIPQSASCRLGSYEECVEYYVCLNGHMVGMCMLLPLSDSEEASEV